jgi:hypothetical protein
MSSFDKSCPYAWAIASDQRIRAHAAKEAVRQKERDAHFAAINKERREKKRS